MHQLYGWREVEVNAKRGGIVRRDKFNMMEWFMGKGGYIIGKRSNSS